MMNAVGYTRYSTDRQSENSTQYQIAAIDEYARKNNINLLHFYSDEGFSGTNTERPAFQQMLSAAETRLFDAIIIYDITRASRDVSDWLGFRKKMRLLGIEVLSATQNLGDALDPDSYLLELINAGIGQHMVLQARQKSIAGTTNKAKDGIFLGGYPPMGYRIENGHYIIEESEAKYVRMIFQMYAAGKSYNDIMAVLNGLRGKRGAVIGKSQLNSILKNERYIGIYTWNKKQYRVMRKWAGGKPNPNAVKIEGIIPPLVSIEIWERVQNRMNDKKRNAANKAQRKYLLSGLIQCEICGGSYTGHTSTNKKGYEHVTYICSSKYRNHTCTAKNLSAASLEEFVLNHVKAYLCNTDFEQEADAIMNRLSAVSPDISSEKKELRQITTQINNGIKAVLGGFALPELQEELDRLRMRKSELEDVIANAENESQKVDRNSLVSYLKRTAEELETNPTAAVKRLAKIYAHADGTCTVNIGVHTAYCGDRI